MSFLAELKRRNVVRVGVFYAVSAWLVLQVGDVLAGLFGLPDWSLRFVGFVLLLGFPLALILSWVYELTPEGIKRESDIADGPRITGETGRKLNVVTTVVAALAIGLVVWQQFLAPAPKFSQHGPLAGETVASSGQKEPVVEATIQPLTIAVLPFANMSGDPENEYFADGVAEEVLNLLARAPELRVISRSSAFTFKGRQVSIPEVARELGATHVLEGSVRRSGDRVRVTAQLIGADEDVHLWSQTFDRELTDIFAVQDEIAAAIANALQVTLGSKSPRSMDMVTYDLVLRARSETSRRSDDGLSRAIKLLEEATSLSPDSAEAWSELAMAQLLLFTYTDASAQSQARVKEYADRALALAPESPSALTALASWHLLRIELDEAEALLLEALAINPNSVDANNWYGDFNMITMRLDTAIKYETITTRLDPLLAVQFYNLGSAYELSKDLASAELHLGRAVALDPGFFAPVVHYLGVMTARRDPDLIRNFFDNYVGPLEGPLNEFQPLFLLLAEDEAEKARQWFRDHSWSTIQNPFWTYLDDWEGATQYLRQNTGSFPNYIWPWQFPTEPEILRANPEYAAYWREPPRDRLLKARGHWIWDD